MIKILFVCHGNICRSTMAEYVMKDLVKKRIWSHLSTSTLPEPVTKKMAIRYTMGHRTN